MSKSFFFYDLETSGLKPQSARIMQFAGQRTDLNLKALGNPVNLLIKLTPDVLPEPEAVLLTGITPQKTLAEGITEADFLEQFYNQIATSNTTFVGFNSIRFDDEFIRYLNYRNLYDPYQWHWQDGRSRWDLLDLVRMTRALRPEGISWPFTQDNLPTNRLELLTKLNKLSHDEAHDALSDVKATIAVAKLIKSKQPELFDYLLNLRDKKSVRRLVEQGAPFIYTSGHYPSAVLHTTAVATIAKHPTPDAALVYDLRYDPELFIKLDIDKLIKAWRYTKDPEDLTLPVKTLRYNRSPAIAPMGVIKDKAIQDRLGLDLNLVNKHLKTLRANQKPFAEKLLKVVDQLNEEQAKNQQAEGQTEVEAQLYDGFIGSSDQSQMTKLHSLKPEAISALKFKDTRLNKLLPLYKARNYPKSLSSDEQASWGVYCQTKLTTGGATSRLATYFSKLAWLAEHKTSKTDQFLLEELLLYGQSLVELSPDVDAAG